MSPQGYTRYIKRFGTAGVLLVGTLLALPALLTPFFLDDYLHSAMVRGTFPAPRSAFDLYDFVDDGDRAELFRRGLLPWWANPHVTIRFFRPLSSALLFLDHKLFGTHPFPMHVHSLLWWGLAVLAARVLFRRVLATPRATLIATAVFALAPCHAVPLAWLANREVLVVLTFGALALVTYAKWRDERRARDAAIAGALFFLALLCGGEYALCFGGYVVGIDLTRRRERVVARATGWLPFFVPAAIYLAVRGALHYGTYASGFYSDPLRDPARFVRRVPIRLATLLAEGWLSLDTVGWFPLWQKIALGVVVVLAIIVGLIVLKRTLSALAEKERAGVTWLLLGSLISLTPVLAVVPSVRLLGIAMLGISVAVAVVIDFAWFGANEEQPGRGRHLTSLVAIGLGFAHFIHGPATLWLGSRQLRTDAAELAWRASAIHGSVGETTSARIGIVRGTAGMFFAPFALSPGDRAPRKWCLLSQSGHVLVLRRGARTIELVTSADRSLYPTGELNLYRSEDTPLVTGDQLTLPGLHVTILQTGELGPTRARLVFDDDPDGLDWFTDDAQAMHRAALPHDGLGEPYDP